MDLGTAAEVVSAVLVIVGLGFAILEVARHRRQRAREAALALVQSYETPEFAYAIYLLPGIPDGLSQQGLEAHLGKEIRLAALLMTTWESLGILTFRGEVGLDLVDDFFSGAVKLSWQKFGTAVEEMRAAGDRETYFEWFQWLAERMAERESDTPPIPAHVEHRGWRPA